MLEITENFKDRVAEALFAARNNYDGSDANFAKKHSINASIYSRIKKGEREKVIRPEQWLNLGRLLDVSPTERRWNMVRTEVFNIIEEEILFCQAFHKSKVFVDACAIGKTYSAKYLSRTLKNCFYVDASQCKTKILFARALAKCVGADSSCTFAETKENIKYYLKAISNPIVIIDEAGDLDYESLVDLKEFWNATDGICGWYLMGADGLRTTIEKGIRSKKGSYRELFSRFSDKFSSAVPTGGKERIAFYRQLITDVLSVNMTNKSKLPTIVNKCLSTDIQEGEATGLRRAESLLILLQ
ncbi:MAG: AAA family ATPase [Parabacteroides gordonii]|uniref:ATP-binding protein n=1 Tax=Parabacteroides TaxID=375288 RepID=UPI001CCDC997|nr:ATP-binding protein [Parabacteroides goldsteinii]UBD75685.1 ATP-binding protein [Parabacteroides goldsteinii]